MTPGDGRAAHVRAPANIAFVKYWGAADVDRAIPLNRSVSMTLSRCESRCTVQPLPSGREDEVLRVGEDGASRPAAPGFAAPVRAHAERLREWAGRRPPLRIATRNTFPSDAGLASSASGFAALTLAVLRVLDAEPDPETLSRLARRSGSGSAARSVFGGYVEWPAGAGEAGPHVDPGDGLGSDPAARPLHGPEHWDLRDVIAIVDRSPKSVPSREGHQRAPTSPHFEARLSLLPDRIRRVRRAVADRDLEALGPVLEEEATELHLIAMSSRPPIRYWSPGTVAVLDAVRALREGGTAAYFTMDAGPNVHVICGPAVEERVARRLAEMDAVEQVIRDRVGPGPRPDDEPLL